ncbi:MAG: plastocyanin/azurin family copper-binding protein [Actinomycetota bacterium]|nr:plastocyanin/azurin family copper-binding protein [Actinomycetota bacterium]
MSLALGGAGCGRGEAPDLINGKTKFVQKCASCHGLQRANASGVQGPNLALVRRNSSMPANLVTRADSSYVAEVAGQPGEDTGELASAGSPDVSNKQVSAKGNRLEIDADPSGALSFVAGKATAPSGAVTLVMKNPAGIPQNIGIEGKKIGPVGEGGTSEVMEKLTPGKYTFLCTVPGHADGGMKGELTVK